MVKSLVQSDLDRILAERTQLWSGRLLLFSLSWALLRQYDPGCGTVETPLSEPLRGGDPL